MIILTWRKRCHQAKSAIFNFQEVGQRRKMVIKIEFTPLSQSPDCKMVSFERVLKNYQLPSTGKQQIVVLFVVLMEFCLFKKNTIYTNLYYRPHFTLYPLPFFQSLKKKIYK